jgi:biotin carboxylase
MTATLSVPAIADPIYFISVTPFNMLGASRYLEGLRFITANDCFGGRWDRVAFTAGTPEAGSDIQSEVARLLGAAASENRVRREEGAHALFLMFDERAESLASGLGLDVCLPAAKLQANLDDKVAGTRLANAAGVPAVPNVLAPIRTYEDLRRHCSHLGADLVVQTPFGDSGESTFFISSEADFRRHAGAIVRERFVKVMKRIRCRQMTIEACNTRCGTFVGPLMKELVGFSELTPHKGGWCGNELVSPGDSALPASLRRQAQHAAIAIGSALAKKAIAVTSASTSCSTRTPVTFTSGN